MLVITAIWGRSSQKEPSYSSASATSSGPLPQWPPVPRSLITPPTRKAGSRPASRARSAASAAESPASEPLTRSPRSSSAWASTLMPAPPIPMKCQCMLILEDHVPHHAPDGVDHQQEQEQGDGERAQADPVGG